MKKIIICLAGLGLMMFMNSCRKLVDEKPLSDGTLNDFFKSKYDADAAIAAMYGQLQQQMVGEGQFKNRYTYWGEARSDNFESTPGTGNSVAVREMHYNALTPNNEFTDWTGLYRLIAMANIKKGNVAAPPQWWKHLRDWKRVFWKKERRKQTALIKTEIATRSR